MILFPAIDLYEKKAVRLLKGNYDNMVIYNEHPLEVARDFEGCGATHVHVVDLELRKVQVTAGATVTEALVLDAQDNVVMPPVKPASQIKQDGEGVYYYVVVPANQQTVRLKLEVHDQAQAVLDWGVYDPENGLEAPMPNIITSGPMIQVNTLTFPTSQDTLEHGFMLLQPTDLLI